MSGSALGFPHSVLLALRQGEVPPTCRELAERLDVPVPTMRRWLNALQRQGYVRQLGIAFTGGRTWAVRPSQMSPSASPRAEDGATGTPPAGGDPRRAAVPPAAAAEGQPVTEKQRRT